MNIGDLPVWFRQFDPFSGGFSFQNMIAQWEVAGVFDFFLPFLLVFAIIFAILSHTRVLGDHKGVNVLIALVLGLFSVRFAFVTDFFGVLFANLGIAVAGLVVLMILAGLFVTKDNRMAWVKTFFVISLVAGTIVVVASINSFAWFGSFWWQRNWLTVLWVGILVILLSAMLFPSKDKGPWGEMEPLRKTLFGGSS